MKRLNLQKMILLCSVLVGAIPTLLLGVTQIVRPQAEIDQTFYSTVSWCGFAFLLAAVFGAFISNRVITPIRQLTHGIQTAAKADFSAPIKETTILPSDIAKLTAEFNKMIARLQESYSGLEEKVAERTKELSDLNQRLEIANNQLVKQKLELEGIFTCMADAVVVTDKYGEMLKMNKAARDLLGTGPVKGSSYKSYARIYNIYQSNGKPFPFVKLPLSRAVLEGETSTNVPMLLKQDEKNRDLIVSAAPLRNNQGEIEAAVAVFRDITPLAEAERKIRHQNEVLEIRNQQIQDASRAKGQFLANMSHELRTPLNAIIGFSQMLKKPRTGELSEKQFRYANNILQSGQHLLELVNDILDLSKIDAAKLNLDLSSIDIRGVIKSVLGVLQPLMEEKKIRLTEKFDLDITSIISDEKRLRQIFFNLLSNAIKFTPEGGNVRFEITHDSKPGYVRFTVGDNGIGISQEDQEHIFDEFHQLDDSYARKQEGTGLGLTLTKKLVELHNGAIQVKSEIGKGSEFIVSLPIAPKPVFVLLVEDNTEVTDLFAQRLESNGFEVLAACNGNEGLDLARNSHPDLIFLDMTLPDPSGLEILQSLKDDPSTSDIPVIIMAGDEMNSKKDIQNFVQTTIRKGDFTFQRLLADVQKVVKIST